MVPAASPMDLRYVEKASRNVVVAAYAASPIYPRTPLVEARETKKERGLLYFKKELWRFKAPGILGRMVEAKASCVRFSKSPG